MNVFITPIDKYGRAVGEDLVIRTFGLPDGFNDETYREYLRDTMCGAYEYYLEVDNQVAGYLAFNVTNDIHRCGDILDVHQLIFSEAYRDHTGFLRETKELIRRMALLYQCRYIARYKHVSSTSIMHITKEI